MSSAAIAQPSDDQLDVVQHPSLGTLKFPKDMAPDERNASIIRMMAIQAPGRGWSGHQDNAPSIPQTSNNIEDALSNSTISPPETGAAAAIDRFKNRIRDLMGANSKPAGDVMGGMILGPLNAAHGAAIAPEHPIRGANQIVGGIGQTLALPMAVTNPGFMAEASPYILAQQGTSAAASKMGADPDVAEFMGNLAVPGAALGMKGTQAAARIAQNNPTVTNSILSLAGGGSALHDLINGRPLDAAKTAIVTAAIKAGIGIAADSDIPNPAKNVLEFLRRGPQREAQAPATPQQSPANATLPNATYLQPEMRALLRPKIAPPSPEINRDVNTNAQEYFIQKMREQMNRQTSTGDEAQQAADQRMAEYAKTPFDRATPKPAATASGPVESPQYAYRSRDAGETGIMPNAKKTAQASLDPTKVQSYQPGRAQAQNHPQEMVRVDLSKLDPSEYEIQPNGYVNFKSAVPESFIEKMGSKAIDEAQPREATSDTDRMDLLMKSIQRVQAKAKTAKAGD